MRIGCSYLAQYSRLLVHPETLEDPDEEDGKSI